MLLEHFISLVTQSASDADAAEQYRRGAVYLWLMRPEWIDDLPAADPDQPYDPAHLAVIFKRLHALDLDSLGSQADIIRRTVQGFMV